MGQNPTWIALNRIDSFKFLYKPLNGYHSIIQKFLTRLESSTDQKEQSIWIFFPHKFISLSTVYWQDKVQFVSVKLVLLSSPFYLFSVEELTKRFFLFLHSVCENKSIKRQYSWQYFSEMKWNDVTSLKIITHIAIQCIHANFVYHWNFLQFATGFFPSMLCLFMIFCVFGILCGKFM